MNVLTSLIFICVFLQVSCVLSHRAKGELRCPACGSSIDLNTVRMRHILTQKSCHYSLLPLSPSQCFRDKAAEVKLASAVLQCTNKGCPWQGEGKNLKVNKYFISLMNTMKNALVTFTSRVMFINVNLLWSSAQIQGVGKGCIAVT